MAGRARRQLVLVVEDDPDLGDTIVTFLKEEGLDAKLARDGDQAMRLLDQLHPSAMILDLMMPAATASACCASSARTAASGTCR